MAGRQGRARLIARDGRRTRHRARVPRVQADPWRAPLSRVRRRRSRDPDCEFCSSPAWMG
ncbi:hypothetical protein DMC25_22390 [Caulobacter sp. D4A]|nr:hypothetical protein DMC25_22390 [Caulobacter sp. D4A]PXA87905.1 hypothetical protein DMC18_20005 [Caulobacter sp. D5]